MKKLICSLIVISLSMGVMAQKSPVEQLFDKYSGQEGYTSVHFTSYMFEIFAKIANEEEDKEFKEASSKLESIKILTIDSALNANRKESFYKEISALITAPEYKDLMIVKDGAEEIKFMIKENGETISELVMIISGGGEGVLMSLIGDIELKEISKLSKSMDIKGMEHLEKVEE